MEHIKYKNKIIEYEIIIRKIKNVYIQIKEGKVIVKAPKRVTKKAVSEIVLSKAPWIINKLENPNQVKPKEIKYEQGEIFKILGQNQVLNIEYKECLKTEVCLDNNILNVYFPLKYKTELTKEQRKEIIKSGINKIYIAVARKEYYKIIQQLTKRTGLSPTKWRIRDIKTAWGSCSSKKSITLSLNLIKYKPEIIEYVIMHELCHLKHMNHSKEFWSLVEKYIPEYKTYRKELKS